MDATLGGALVGAALLHQFNLRIQAGVKTRGQALQHAGTDDAVAQRGEQTGGLAHEQGDGEVKAALM
jgi:hypothetical protein